MSIKKIAFFIFFLWIAFTGCFSSKKLFYLDTNRYSEFEMIVTNYPYHDGIIKSLEAYKMKGLILDYKIVDTTLGKYYFLQFKENDTIQINEYLIPYVSNLPTKSSIKEFEVVFYLNRGEFYDTIIHKKSGEWKINKFRKKNFNSQGLLLKLIYP